MRSAALALFAAATAGCAAGAPPAAGGSAVKVGTAESLRLELALPPHVRAGEPVRIALRAHNPTTLTVDLHLRGRAPTLDVVIARAGGEIIWQRLEGEIIPAIVHLRALAPGESLDLAATWDQRTREGATAGPGTYVATALLLTDGAPLRTEPVSFEIRR
jgi:hypothetical protein